MRDLFVAHPRERRKAPDTLEGALDLRSQQQLIARRDRFAEARLIYPDEIEAGLLVRDDVRAHEAYDACCLRQSLDDHDPWHERPTRKVPLEERLVIGDILERANALAGAELEHAIDEQEWKAMGQSLEDRMDVELSGISLRCHLIHRLPPHGRS